MSDAYDVIILGAGIVGAACAMECALAHMKVAVVESEVVGGGATAAGMGHIVVMDDSPAQLALTHYSQQLWQKVSSRLPLDVEYEATGTIWVAKDQFEMEEVHRKHSLYETNGIPSQVLDRAALAEAEPNLRPDLAGGLLVSGDAVLYPPCAARYLLEEAIRAGALVVRGVVASIGHGSLRLRDGTTLTSTRIVNATGAAASELTNGLAVRKRKGHLAITDRAPGFVHHQLVELGYLRSAGSGTADSVAFNVQPRKTGQLLIGSSRQYDDDARVDQSILSRMLQRAQEYLPGIANLSVIRTWTGFRAATPEKLPLIGPSPGDPTVFLATGHEGLGITTSLATAKLLVDHFEGRSSAIPLSPYLPSRMLLEPQHA